MVITTSASRTAVSERSAGRRRERSIPFSSIATTTFGLISLAGSVPAESTCMRSPDRCSVKPAAIWLRPALWAQTKSTVGRVISWGPSTMPESYALCELLLDPVVGRVAERHQADEGGNRGPEVGACHGRQEGGRI